MEPAHQSKLDLCFRSSVGEEGMPSFETQQQCENLQKVRDFFGRKQVAELQLLRTSRMNGGIILLLVRVIRRHYRRGIE